MKTLSLLHKIFRTMLYLLVALLLVWVIAVQAGCFTMRIPDKDWQPKLQELGQTLAPQFYNIPSSMGRTIHTVCVGANDSLPLVIMVHGSPGSADANLTYMADTALTKVARIASLDRPGFGYTTGFGKPEPSQAAQAAALKSVADFLAPGRKVLLVGHSLGGPVIARFAMDYPEQTAGMVIVAGSIDPTEEEHPWWQSVVAAPPVRWLTPKPLWTSNAEIIPLEKELSVMMPMWDRITSPVRLIHALDDQLVPVGNAAFARKMLVNCPDFKATILPTGNHFILWSRQDLVRQAMLELLR